MDFLYIDDVVAVSVAPAQMPSMVRGFVASQVVTGQGGTAPYTYAISAGALPAGLSLVGDTVAGILNTAGAYDFTVRATDSVGRIGTRRYTGTIATPVITITPASLTTLTTGSAASVDFDASGGSGAYTWSLDSGALPAGLALNASTGVVSGTPTTAGPYICTLKATDAYGNVGLLALSGSVLDPYPIGYQMSFPACSGGICIGEGSWGANPAYGTMISSGSVQATSTPLVSDPENSVVFRYYGSIMQEDANGRLNFRVGNGGVYGISGSYGSKYFQMPGTPAGRRWRLDNWDTQDYYTGGHYENATPATVTRVA